MQEPPITVRSLLFSLLFASIIVAFSLVKALSYPYAVIVFCDVGQGDGTYIRIKGGFDILIDAGPDRKILSCLGRYMPFYDKTIELALLSHPQKDHYGGFVHVLDHYRIESFASSRIGSANKSFDTLMQKLQEKKTMMRFIFAHDSIRVGQAKLQVLWPTKNYVQRYAKRGSTTTQNKHNGPAMHYPDSDPNNFSQVLILSLDTLNVMFTGDITTSLLPSKLISSQPKIDILKVPHHGSKNGLTSDFIKLADPLVSVISCGKRNAYGHPAAGTLELLLASGSKIRRTDVEGHIVFEAK